MTSVQNPSADPDELELYAETGQVGFIGRMESDGMPVLAEAFSRLKVRA